MAENAARPIKPSAFEHQVETQTPSAILASQRFQFLTLAVVSTQAATMSNGLFIEICPPQKIGKCSPARRLSMKDMSAEPTGRNPFSNEMSGM
jgi:hypothetical protein